MAFKCSRCGKRPVSHATKNDYWCSTCKNEYQREYWERTKPDRRERKAITTRKNEEVKRKWVMEFLLAHPCVDCGEPDPIVLDFDHDQTKGDKDYPIAHLVKGTWSLKRLQAEVEKCVVRCANCHRRKTFHERGYWKAAGLHYEWAPHP